MIRLFCYNGFYDTNNAAHPWIRLRMTLEEIDERR